MVNEAQSNEADSCTRRSVEAVRPKRRLRRLATVFDRLIELPLSADATEEPGMIRDDMDLDRWRLRLPELTRLELTSVFCKNGVLTVIVPKGAAGEN